MRDAGRLYARVEAADGLISSLIFTLNLVYQATVIGLSPLQLVLVGTVLEIVVLLAELPTGAFADLHGRRPAVVVGYALIGAGFTFEGAIPAFWAVLVAQVLWGTGAAFTSGAFQAWLVDETSPDDAAPVILRAARLANVGGIAGIALSVAVGWQSPRVPVVIGGLAWMLLALALWRSMGEERPTRGPGGTVGLIGQGRAGLRVVRAVPVALGLTLVQLFGGLSSEALDRLSTPRFLALGLPGGLRTVAWFGLIAAGAMLVGAIGIRAAERLERTDRSLARALLGAQALQVAVVVAFAATGSFALALAAWWALGLLRTVQAPLAGAWLNRHIPSATRATTLSLHSQANALGQVVGGPICGAVASGVSVRAALLVSAIFLAPAAAVLAALRRRLASAPGVE
jgi:DHA3 family tetracycline resistance protein-like MFS transporter